MKKRFKNELSSEYIRRHHSRKERHRLRRIGKVKDGRYFERYGNKQFTLKPTLYAEEDIRLFSNRDSCLKFIRELRGINHLSIVGSRRFVTISLRLVKFIDYAFISILTAVVQDLKFKGIHVTGDLPIDPTAKQYIIESGFRNNLYSNRGQRFKDTIKSEMVFFEQGTGDLSLEDNIRISKSIKKVVKYLTGREVQFLPVKTILLEICGNSIEYGNTIKRQWLLGIKYEDNRAIFTVTDVGSGILSTLHRKFGYIIRELFKENHEILYGAFCQKYGSSTQEINRNKGLPVVKHTFEDNKILNLKVVSNNVILHFDNSSESLTFPLGSCRFKGTFYQWELDANCLKDIL